MAASSAVPSRAASPAASPAPSRILRWVLIWIGVVLAIAGIGTAGYVVLFGWSLSDAIYMTIITLTTEGYKEVRALDDAGRAWTVLLALAGVGIIFGTVGFVAETFVAEALSGRREQRRMTQAIEGLRNHFILCGYGRVGTTAARELQHAGVPVVVIDSNPDAVAEARRAGHLAMVADATHDEVLVQAGVSLARGLVTTVDTDAQNVYVTLTARSLNPKLFIVARANEDGSDAKLRQAGADRAVSPYTRAGQQIAELATRPHVADFIDFALSHGQVSFSIEELEVVAGSRLAGQTVADLIGRGIHVMAVVTHGPRPFQTNPPMDRKLEPGDQLIVSGTAEVLRPLRETV
jgi:voltage-gated potassium channel